MNFWKALVVTAVIGGLHYSKAFREKDDHEGAKLCANSQFRKDRLDTFTYVGVIENGVLGTTTNSSRMKILAEVVVRNWKGCDFYLKINSYDIYESLGNSDDYKQLPPHGDLVKRLTNYPLRFKMRNGMVTDLHPIVESTEADVLNIQRGILSMFQVRSIENGEDIESLDNDVSGRCKTRYAIRKQNDREFGEEKVKHLEKFKDLNSCTGHFIAHSNIYGVPYGDNEKDPVLKSASKCYYKLNRKKRIVLKNIVCKEEFLVQPFSSDAGAGAYVKSRTQLTRKNSRKVNEESFPYANDYTTTIMYDHNHQHISSHIPEYKTTVIDTLNKLSTSRYYKSDFDSAAMFFDLVASLRHLDINDLIQLVNKVDITKESERFLIFDSLAQCGTPSCLNILFKTMNDHRLHEEAVRFMPYLAFVKEPTPEILRMLMGMHQQTKEPNILLLISSLVYRMCEHRQKECEETGIIGKIVEDTEYYFIRLLGNNCQTDNPQKQEEIFFSLRGIGNMGRPNKALPLIRSCIEQARRINISVAAIQAFRRMTLTNNIKDFLLKTFADMNQDLEKRVEVFLLLMKTASKEFIILARDIANHEGESRQMKSFISSYLKSAMKNTDPSKMKITVMLKEVLEKHPLKEFNFPSSKYSKAFMHSANLYRFAGTSDGMVLFHPESFVPRTLNLNLTAHIFGFSVNALEMNARLEGLEMLLGHYFGNTDRNGGEYFTNIFKIPNENLESMKRTRRSTETGSNYEDIDQQVNMKRSSPQALVSLKVFGNEIQVLSLKDIPFLNGKYNDVNVIKELYQFTKGKRKTLKQNMVLLEVSHSVPTILGLPLKIGVNASAVTTIDIKGKVESSNILFGIKKLKIHGSIRPSVSIHASSLLSVECIGVAKIGTSFHANVHGSRNLHGSVEYEEGKEIRLDLNADTISTDILNISYNMFHENTDDKVAISGIEKRTKGLVCTDEIFNSTSLFGINTCAEISFPIGYYNASVPYFPLSGPFSFGLRNYLTDPLLKKYQLIIKNLGRFYEIKMQTPDASINREFVTQVGVTKKEDGGTIGVTFGNDKKGIVLEYKFQKMTNEIQVELLSNFTQTPLLLYGEFFNNTDQSNLDKKMGGRFKFSFANYYVNYVLFYKHTYQYWALGSNVQYSPGLSASFDLKIQYEPQVFYVKIEHPPTNTKITAEALPTLPFLMGKINITHGNNVDIRTYGFIDILKYEVKGDMFVNPGRKKVTADGKLYPNERKLLMTGDINGLPVSWHANLTLENNNKVIRSHIMMDDKTLINKLTWNNETLHALIKLNNFVSSITANIKKLENNLNFKTKLDLDGRQTELNLNFQNNSNSHEYCLTGNFMELAPFGYCFNIYMNNLKNGFNLKVLSSESQWIVPVSVLYTRTPLESLLIANYMKEITISLKQKTDSILFNVNVLGAYLEMIKSIGDFDKTLILFGYTNNTSMKPVFTQKIGFQKRIADNRVQEFSFTTNVQSNTLIQITSKSLGQTFQYRLNLLFNENSPEYSILIRSDESKSEVEGSRGQININWNQMKNTIQSIDFIYPEAVHFQIAESKEENQHKIYLRGKPFSSQSNLSDIGIITYNSNGIISYRVSTNNQLVQGILPILQQSQENIIENLVHSINYILVKYFKEPLKLEENDFVKIQELFTSGLLQYTSTLKCNKDEIIRKYIEGKIGFELTAEIFIRTLNNLAFTNDLAKLFNTSSDVNTISSESKQSFNTENVLGFISKIINAKMDEIPEATENIRGLLKVDSVNKNSKIGKKFVSYMSNTVQILQLIYSKRLYDDSLMNAFLLNMTKDFPSILRPKYILTTKNLMNMTRTWKYDTKLKPSENIETFAARLRDVKFHELFQYNFLSEFSKQIILESNLPKKITEAVIDFLDDSDHLRYVTRLNNFLLIELRVRRSTKGHIAQLLSSNSVDEYFYKLSSIALKHGRIGPKKKAEFRKYQNTRDAIILVNVLKELLRERYKLQEKSLKVLDELVFAELYLNSTYLTTSLLRPNFLPPLRQHLLNRFKTVDFWEFILKLMNLLVPEFDNNIVQMFLKRSHSLEEVKHFGYIYLQKIIGSNSPNNKQQLTHIIGELFDKLIEFSLSTQDVTDNKVIAKDFKNMLIQYYDVMVSKMNSSAETKWRNGLSLLLSKSKQHLIKIRPEDLVDDASNEILKLIENTLQEFSVFASDYVAAFVKEDLLMMVKRAASTTPMDENDTLLTVYQRTYRKFDEYMNFLIRLLGQFSSSQTNPFIERFMKNNKIQYYKIYQSIWKGKVDNEFNSQQIQQLLNGLEGRAFEEIFKFTGNYSLIATVNNIFNYVKSLNYSDVNTMIDSYKDIDVNHFTNLTHDALIHHIQLLFNDLGQLKHGDSTLDSLVYQALPTIALSSENVYETIEQAFRKKATEVKDVKILIKNAFKYVHSYLKDSEEKNNSLFVLMVDVLVPGLNGLIALQDKKENQYHKASLPNLLIPLNATATYDCSQAFMTNYGSPLVSSNSSEILKTDKELRELFQEFKESSTCQILSLKSYIKNLKKDRSIIYEILAETEIILLKILNEHLKTSEKYMNVLKAVMTDWVKLDDSGNQDGTLQTFLFSLIQKSTSAVNNLTVYKQVRRAVRRSMNLKKFEIKGFLQKFFIEKVQKYSPTFSFEQINNQANTFISSVIKTTTLKIQQLSFSILKTVDALKIPLADYKLITHPYEYLLEVPKTILNTMESYLKANKMNTLTKLKTMEKKIQNLYKATKKLLKQNVDSYKEILSKFKDIFGNVTSKYIGIILSHIDNYATNLSMPSLNGDLKTRLSLLSTQTRIVKQKQDEMLREIIEELLKSASKGLTREISNLDEYALTEIKKNAGFNTLINMTKYLTTSLHETVQSLWQPQVEVLANMVDKVVCDLKKNITKFYTNKNGVYVLKFESPEFVQAFTTYDVTKNIVSQAIMNLSKTVESTSQDLPISKANYQYFNALYNQFVHEVINQQIKAMFGQMKRNIKEIRYFYQTYAFYANQHPGFIVEQAFLKYQDNIRQLALKVNKAIKIIPPTDFEKPIIKFLGLEFQEYNNELMKPIARTAYIFQNSIVTYDGKAIYLPRDLQHKYGDCKFLLTRDFFWKNFTMYLYRGNFVVELQDGRVEIERYRKNQVHIYRKVPPYFQEEQHMMEMPVQMMFTTISILPNLLKIENVFGLLIYCQLDQFACNVTLPGYYHNKTLGLFGTNNVEYSDDLRMPNGKLALDLPEFVNSYELSRDKSKCTVDGEAIFGSSLEINIKQKKQKTCQKSFRSKNVESQSADVMILRSAFSYVCSVEDVCSTMQSYRNSLKREAFIDPPSQCGHCSEDYITFNKKLHQPVVITLILKLTTNMKDIKNKLKESIFQVHREISSQRRDIKYCVIGYQGNNIRLLPHIQTGSRGKVLLNIDGAGEALDQLEFQGLSSEKRHGLDALKFASLLELDQKSIRIFLLVDDDASYTTNTLQQKMIVYNLMTERSIVLNTINSYKLRKDIIGRDSFGMRYHNRLASGERFPATFPPADDYIPLVKNTGGGIFTLQAFTNPKRRWIKALPIAMATAINLQIEREIKSCKGCKCHMCKNVDPGLCKYGL